MAASVAVVGAGIVGVTCALELQRRGRSVTLLDRGEPGGEASYGNSGLLARSSLVPFNHPGIWSSLPKLLENKSTRFRYDPAFLLRNPGWVARFLASARPAAFEATKSALNDRLALPLREAFPIGERLDGEAWIGARPTLPDSRPVIRPCTRNPGLWLAFGHQHVGLSTGPGTAALLGDLITGARPQAEAVARHKMPDSRRRPGAVATNFARNFPTPVVPATSFDPCGQSTSSRPKYASPLSRDRTVRPWHVEDCWWQSSLLGVVRQSFG